MTTQTLYAANNVPNATFFGLSGTAYKSDSTGMISGVLAQDIGPLVYSGNCMLAAPGNSGSTTTLDLTTGGAIPSTATTVDIRQTASGTYTLPALSSTSGKVTITDGLGNFAIYNATIVPAGGNTIANTGQVAMATNGESLTFNPDYANNNWEII